MIIINADDFGLSDSVNRAIAAAFSDRLISDTTMLANGKAFDGAITLANKEGFSDKIGIHFNLTEGEPLTDDIKKCSSFCENGVFHGKIDRLKPLSRAEKSAVYTELSAQVQKIRSACLNIDHADSHHHMHTAVFIAPIVFRVCSENGITKIRLHRNIGAIPSYKRAIKNLYNKNLFRKGFLTVQHFGSLDDIKGGPLPDSLEVMVHPDYDKGGVLIDRRDFDDGVPVGVSLPSLEKENGVKLTSYGEI